MSSKQEMPTYLDEGIRADVFDWLLNARYWLGFMVGISGENFGDHSHELKFSWHSNWGIRVFISPNGELSPYHKIFKEASYEFRYKIFEYCLPKRDLDFDFDAGPGSSFLNSISEIEYLIQKFFPNIHCANTWTLCNVLESNDCYGKKGYVSLCNNNGKMKICEKCSNARDERKAKGFDGFVYLIGNRKQKIYKIGLSRQPKERFKAFNTKLPFTVEILHQIEATDMKKAEKLLHDWMKDKNTHGEWFNLSQKEIDFICKLVTFEKDNFRDNLGNVVLKHSK